MALLSSSCSRREVEPVFDKRGISLIVTEAVDFQTKSASSDQLQGGDDLFGEGYKELIYEDDSIGDIFLEMTESYIHTGIFDSLPGQTKGAPYQGDNIGDFYVTAFLSSDAQNPYFEDLKLNSSGGEVGTGYYWPLTTPETKLSFFGYAKNSETEGIIAFPGGGGRFILGPKDANDNYTSMSGFFAYSAPDPEGDDTAAEEEPDVVFAIAPNLSNTGAAVPMKFFHALSSIVFEVGSVPANFVVEKVEFKNLYSSGNCTYTSNMVDEVTFNWTPAFEKESFLQTFNKKMSDADGVVADVNINSAVQTFMMVPQSVEDDAQLEITVSIEHTNPDASTYRNEYKFTKSLDDICAAFEAGKKYTFRISSPEEVDVEVEDQLSGDGSVKSDVEISNTGISVTYIRVLLHGSWVSPGVDGNPDILLGMWNQPMISTVDPAKLAKADGAFVQAAGFSSNWIEGSDGFYYYKHQLKPGEKAEPLFDKYTLTAAPQIEGAVLDLSVVVQSVLYNKIEQTGWPVKVWSISDGGDGKTLISK